MLLSLLTITFLLAYAGLILFYYVQWKRLKECQPCSSSPAIFVSLIVAARNEELSLPLLLADLKQQDYPSHLLEVIIVNDFSADKTEEVFKKYAGTGFRMIHPDASPETSSKKKAIATGVKEAKGELIIITDADCRVKKSWVSTVVNFYKESSVVFIAAPVKFTPDNSLLQIFQSLDFMMLQGITAASVASGFHNMCNGANVAYTKKVFEEVAGFEGIDKIATGDDMLLMHKIWKRHPGRVSYLKNKQAIVTTAPAPTWKDFFMQRRRWASKTLVYEDYKIILVLVFVLLFNVFAFVVLGAAIIDKKYWFHFFCFLAGKTIIEWPFLSSVAAFYDEKKLMRYFFLFQPVHIFYTVVVGIWSQFGGYEWKGRKTSRR